MSRTFEIHCHSDRRAHDCKDLDRVCAAPPIIGNGEENCLELCLAQGPQGPGPQGAPGPLYVDANGCLALCIDNVTIQAVPDPAQGNRFCLTAPGSMPPIGTKAIDYDPVTGCLGWQITYANTLFVTENGDNSTAQRTRLDCPYATPWAAIEDAQNGDTVYVFAGTYTSTDLTDRVVADNVKMWCQPNVIINSNAELFWDDGNQLIGSEFRGFANVTLTNTMNRVLTSANNSIIIEGNEFTHEAPFTVTNGSSYFYTVRRDEVIGSGSLVTVNLPLNTDMNVKYHADLAIAGDFTDSQIVLEGISFTGDIDVWVGRLQMIDTHTSNGVVFLSNNLGHQKIHIDDLEQIAVPPVGTSNRPVLGFDTPSGELDIRIRGISNTDGLGYRGNSIITQNLSGVVSTGFIELEGRWLMDEQVGSPFPSNNIGNFAPMSRVNLILDANVDGTAIARTFLNTNNAPGEFFITGRLNYVGGDILGHNAFRLNIDSVSSPTFRDLVISTDRADGPLENSVLGPAIPVKMLKVFCNVPLNLLEYTPLPIAPGSSYIANAIIVA